MNIKAFAPLVVFLSLLAPFPAAAQQGDFRWNGALSSGQTIAQTPVLSQTSVSIVTDMATSLNDSLQS